jgi:hypothetical protein
MAVYKVIQDVEAEDKILGPLSLKQLIFAGVAFGSIFIAFRLVVATGVIYLAIPFLPIIFIFGFLAAPIGRDQPTEMWLAAQIRFFTKPRVRIWDQSDIKNLVNITAPKREEKVYTDGLNQQQVHSRLKALANTLDSRGWAVKNVDINLYATDVYGQEQSDRLVDPSSLPVAVSEIDIKASDDIMDVANNETAHHFDEMMQASGQAHKNALLAKMQQPTQTAAPSNSQQDYWFMHQPEMPKGTEGQVMFDENIVQPATTLTAEENTTFLKEDSSKLSATEQEIVERARKAKETTQSQYSAHHKVILTPEQQKLLDQKRAQEEKEKREQEERIKEEELKKATQQQKTQLTKTDKMNLVESGFKLDTISSLAKHKTEEKHDDGEVVIKLR